MLQLLKKIKTPKNNEIRSEINSLNYIHQIAHTVHYIYVNYAHKHTLASSSSVSVLTPNRGMFEFVRLDECCSFFTPLIWDMGLFFFSFSFCVWGDGISTSCCLSGETQCRKKRTEKWIQRLSRMQEGGRVYLPVSSLTQEGVGDELRDLVPRAAHLREVRELSIQHPLELKAEHTRIWIMGSVSRKKA